MINKNVLFDTENYMNEEFLENYGPSEILEELKNILNKYINKPRGQVSKWIMLSKEDLIENLDEVALEEALLNLDVDRIILNDNNGTLQVVTYYNGINVYEIKSLSKSNKNYYNSSISYDSHENQIEFVEKLPSLKIKKSKRSIKVN